MKKSFSILAAGIAVSLLLAGCMKSQAEPYRFFSSGCGRA